MRDGRVSIVLIFTLSCVLVESKVFTRCQLTRELLKNNFPRSFMSNWVCLVEQESGRNTSAFVDKSTKRKYYGLFQIGREYCKDGRRGGKCDITCESLLDEDIRDDAACAMRVFDLEGFKYWARWAARCKGHTLPDISKCPDWQYPPNRSSVSPNRDKRTLRWKRAATSMKRDWLNKIVGLNVE